MKGGYELFRHKHNDPFTGEECSNDRDFELLTEDETGNLAMACEDCDLIIGLWVRVADEDSYEWGMRDPRFRSRLVRMVAMSGTVVAIVCFILFLIFGVS